MKDKRLLAAHLPILAYIIVCTVWGSTYLAIRIAVMDLPPMTSAGVRFTLAGLLMYAYMRWKGLSFPGLTEIRQQSLVGLCLLWGGNGLVMVGSQWVDSGVASLLFATIPFFMAVFGLLLPGGEKLRWFGWLGLVLGFAGVGMLVLNDIKNLGFPLKGLAVILVGAASWAYGSVYSKGIRSTVSMPVNLTIQTLAGGIGLLIAGLLMGEAKNVSLTLNGVLAILYLIFFGSLLGYNTYIYLLSVWPVARVGTYAYINPLVALFLGNLILDEPVGVSVIFATATILAGVFLVQMATVK